MKKKVRSVIGFCFLPKKAVSASLKEAPSFCLDFPLRAYRYEVLAVDLEHINATHFVGQQWHAHHVEVLVQLIDLVQVLPLDALPRLEQRVWRFALFKVM